MIMEDFVYFFLGIVVTIIVGIFSYPKRNIIQHFVLESYDIGKGLRTVFPNFKLTYKNSELSTNVRVLKGGFMNIVKDIEFKKEESIELKLPKECKVKDVNLLKSDKLKVNYKIIEDNLISFTISDVFLKNEFFKYAIIVETDKEDVRLHNNLSFEHRIPHTKRIGNMLIYGLKKISLNKRRYKLAKFVTFIYGFLVLILCGLLFFTSFNKGWTKPASFKIFNNETKEEVMLEVGHNQQFYILNKSDLKFPYMKKGRPITKSKFENNYTICPEVKDYWIHLVPFALLLMLLILLPLFFWKYNKQEHIKKILINSNSVDF